MELELKKECLDTYELGEPQTLTQEETAETIVPDYCPDIARIISADHQEHQQSRWKNGRDEDACPHGDGEYSNDAVPSSPKHPAPPPFLTAQYMTAPLSPVPVFFRNRMRVHVLFHRSGDQMSVASMGSFAIGRRRVLRLWLKPGPMRF